MSFTTLKSETLFHGRVFDLRRDEVRYPNGLVAQLDIVQHNGAVAMLPLDEEGRIHFVRQYRHAAGAELLELPAGTLEDGETPETCARRELREEIGMAANHWVRLGEFFLAPGYSTERIHLFLARELQPEALEPDEDEFLQLEPIPMEKAFELARSGEIRDAKTLAGLYLAQPHLQGL